jgi:hypothetical protein
MQRTLLMPTETVRSGSKGNIDLPLRCVIRPYNAAVQRPRAAV